MELQGLIKVLNFRPRFCICAQWDDETDMAKLEECVRSVQADGLLWGASKLVPVGYGIKKLQINCVVEDDKVGTDLLEEEITKFEDYVSIQYVPSKPVHTGTLPITQIHHAIVNETQKVLFPVYNPLAFIGFLQE